MQIRYTRADWEALPEGFPAQLLGGELLREPSPTYGHEDVRMGLLRRLMPLVGRGLLVAAPVDVLVDAHNVFQPDIAVLGQIPPRHTSYVGTPRVVFEILSPRTAARDRGFKAPRYLALGVAEVWLIDPAAQRVEVRTPGEERTATGARAIGSDVIPGFVVRPRELFD